MSVHITLKNYLKDKIEALSSVQQVYGYMPPNFSGYPAVAILLPELNGEFSSTAEDSRVYSFRINVFMPLGQDIESPKTMAREEYAENVLATVVEDICNALDTDFAMDDVTSITTRYMTASDMQPFEMEIDGGLHLGAEITINIYTEKIVV